MVTFIDGELREPIMREDVSFSVADQYGDRFGCLGVAYYFEECTVLVHVGSRLTSELIEDINPQSVELNGKAAAVISLRRSRKTDQMRFVLRGGYSLYYDENGHDADRQLHLTETVQ